MADGLTDDQVGQTLDYLGGNQPLATQRLTTLPSASAAGGGSVAPAVAAAGPSSAIADGGGITGGGSIAQPGPSTASVASSAGENALDIARRIIGSGEPDATRGNTGGTSLSDQVRSGSPTSVAAVDPAISALQPGSPAAVAAQAAAQANASAPASVLPNATGSGIQALTSGEAAASVAEGAAPVAEEVAKDAAINTLELTLPSLADVLSPALTLGLVPIIEGFFNTGILNDSRGLQDLFHPNDPFKETKNIRSDFTKAFPSYQGQEDTLAQVSAATDPAQLKSLLNQASYQVNQGPAVSQFLSTHGGARKGLVAPLDVSPYEKVTGELSRSGVLAGLLASDRLAQMGQLSPEDDAAGSFANPQGYLGILFAQAGIPTPDGGYESVVTPQEMQALQTPGNRVQTLQAILSRLNPDFMNTDFGAQFSSLQPAPTPAAPTQDQAQEVIQAAPAPAPVMPSGPAGALGFASDVLGS